MDKDKLLETIIELCELYVIDCPNVDDTDNLRNFARVYSRVRPRNYGEKVIVTNSEILINAKDEQELANYLIAQGRTYDNLRRT